MSKQNYTTNFTVDTSPAEVFKAIINPRAWWSEEIEGRTDELGAVFYYHYQDQHRVVVKVTELEPGKKVVWQVLYSTMEFVKDKEEWTGTDIVFDISEENGKTTVDFTHVGLVPMLECYGLCVDGWSNYITGSLRSLITTGKGYPNKGEAITDSERSIA